MEVTLKPHPPPPPPPPTVAPPPPLSPRGGLIRAVQGLPGLLGRRWGRRWGRLCPPTLAAIIPV